MMSDHHGLIESGSREVRYVLVNGAGQILTAREDHRDAQAWAERLGITQGRVQIIREDRTVVPDGADADLWGVADLATIHEALTAAHAILEGEADELAGRRPHPSEYRFLYDVEDGLRLRAERVAEVLDAGLEAPAEPELETDGGEPEPFVQVHTHTGKPGVIVELRPAEHAEDPPSERDMTQLSDSGARDLYAQLGEYLGEPVNTVTPMDEYRVDIRELPPRHPHEPPLVEVTTREPVKQAHMDPREWRYVFKLADWTDMVTKDRDGLHAILRAIYAPEPGNTNAGPDGYASVAVNGGVRVPEFVREALMEYVDDLVGFGRPPFILGRDGEYQGMEPEPARVETHDGEGVTDV